MAKSALFTVRNNESCPKCGAELVIRSGKHGPFLGCSQYPACDYVRPLKSSADGHIVKVLEGQVCLHVAQIWYYARDALVCLLVALTTLNANIPNLSINRTKQQLHAPMSDGHLVQRRSRYGKTFHSCDRYPECQFAINFKPIAGECPECHYPLLIEKKTAQGVKHFCASKQCGKPVSAE